jgi:hypothetical protein
LSAIFLGVHTDTSYDCQYESNNAFHSLQIKLYDGNSMIHCIMGIVTHKFEFNLHYHHTII